MSKKTRTSREEIDPDEVDITKPFDVELLGSAEDPCFGELWDPVAPECKLCGDNEFCAVVFQQNRKKLRKKEEKTLRLIEHDDIERTTFAKKMLKKYDPKKARLKVKKKFKLTAEQAKNIIDAARNS